LGTLIRVAKVRVIAALLPGFLWAATSAAQTVRVENPTGHVIVKLVDGDNLAVRPSSPVREIAPGDVATAQKPGVFYIEARPRDGAQIDIEVDLPYGLGVQARTKAGRISLHGFVRSAELLTESGDIELTAPWSAIRLFVLAQHEPRELILSDPELFSAAFRQQEGQKDKKEWVLADRLPPFKTTYGKWVVNATTPGKLTVRDTPIPPESPVKLPWQAPAVLDDILQQPSRRPPAPRPPPADGALLPSDKEVLTVEEGAALFTSEVHMVNLTLAAYDAQGHPLTGLGKDDFQIAENNQPQQVAFAASEEAPFNLALLLDLSGSAKEERDAMKEAAKRFIDIARPQDRVAVYALARDMFQVVSPLSADRDKLRGLIEAIPEVSGGTPLYDAIVLAYAQELRQRPGERNALIVLSDGVDNQLYGQITPSEVSFKKLQRAAQEFETLIYPIFLNPVGPDGRMEGFVKKAHDRLQELAQATGGKLFSAKSIRDLDPIYPQVESELRSVYTVAYYPSNQKFDGTWREVDVSVKNVAARVRTRPGYYAR
jgi:VWFA-related protein